MDEKKPLSENTQGKAAPSSDIFIYKYNIQLKFKKISSFARTVDFVDYFAVAKAKKAPSLSKRTGREPFDT